MTETTETTYGDCVIEAMAEGGVSAVFFTSGSDIPFYPEAISRRAALGLSHPKLYTMPHEITSLNAALGYAAFSERPVATAAHVGLGTQNYGSAVHTAYRSHLPVLLTAGCPPTATPGTMPGARDGVHFWEQQVPDQNGILRQFTRWEHRLNFLDNPGTVVSRALQMALAEPSGPVYLSIPRELQMLPTREQGFATVQQLGVPTLCQPDVDTVQWLLRRIVDAEDPVVVVGAGGRHRASWPLLQEFVELFGIPVVNGPLRGFQAMEHSHPLYRHQRSDLSQADLLLVLEQDLPWMPGPQAPAQSAVKVFIDPDPVVSRMKLIEYEYDLRLTTDTTSVIRAVLATAREVLSEPELTRLSERRRRAEEDVRFYRAATQAAGDAHRRADYIDPVWAAAVVARFVKRDSIVLDDTIDSAPVFRFLSLSGRGEHLQNQSSSGGWAIGAAVGAKLARPDQEVVMVSGDGFYMFGVPTAALWAARAHHAPFLGVVFQNDSYNTGTEAVAHYYPRGYAQLAGFPGGYLSPGVDFAREAEACGAFGVNVETPAQLEPALATARAAVESGTAAIVAIRTPKLDATSDWGSF